MDELVDLMQQMLSELQGINEKLDEIKGIGVYNSLADVCDKLDNVIGTGLYNSLSDVCDKLDSLDTTITMGSNY